MQSDLSIPTQGQEQRGVFGEGDGLGKRVTRSLKNKARLETPVKV